MFSSSYIRAQYLLDMVDTNKETGRGLLTLYKKSDHLRIGGYIQPQFQVAGSKVISQDSLFKEVF